MDRLSSMTTFVTVVDCGSFSAAARRLNVGQPAVSKTIAQLEDYLGVPLVARSTRGLAPTEAGIRFYECARLAIEHADKAEVAARGEGAGLTGTLYVAAAPTFTRLHIMPHLAEFMAAHPELDVELVLDDRAIDLVEERIDVSLRMGPLPDSSATAKRIATSSRCVMSSRGYLEKIEAPKSPAELADHQVIVHARQRVTAWTFARGSSKTSVAVGGRLRTNNAEGLRAAVLSGMAVTIASRWMFAPELSTGEVQVLLPEWDLPPVDLWAVYPSGKRVSAKARAFIEHVEKVLCPAAAQPTQSGDVDEGDLAVTPLSMASGDLAGLNGHWSRDLNN